MKASQKKVARELAEIKKVFSQNDRFDGLVEEKMSSLWTRFKKIVVLFFTMLNDYINRKFEQSTVRKKAKAVQGLNNLIDYANNSIPKMDEDIGVLGNSVKTSGLYAYVQPLNFNIDWIAKSGASKNRVELAVLAKMVRVVGALKGKESSYTTLQKDGVAEFIEQLFHEKSHGTYDAPRYMLFERFVEYANNRNVEREFEKLYANILKDIRKQLRKSLKEKVNQASSLKSELA